jgi:hypothetical protein
LFSFSVSLLQRANERETEKEGKRRRGEEEKRRRGEERDLFAVTRTGGATKTEAGDRC